MGTILHFTGSSNTTDLLLEDSEANDQKKEDEVDDEEEDEDMTTTMVPPAYEISKEEISVEMRAVLESRPLTIYSDQNASPKLGGWTKEDDVRYHRTLQCTVSRPMKGQI